MSFSENMAKVIADQIARLVTLNRHRLAAQVANLDFWIDQARHALGVIDGYEARFRRLKAGQDEYVARHGVREFSPCGSSISRAPDPPRRVPHGSLREARRSVTEATYKFLVRCHNDGLIPESRLRAICRELDIGVEARDLHRREGAS